MKRKQGQLREGFDRTYATRERDLLTSRSRNLNGEDTA